MGYVKRKKGFTVMELTIVVILIGIIAAFGIPGYQKTVQKSRENNAMMQMLTVHQANEVYTAKVGEYLPGAGLNLTQINSGLSVNIMPYGMTHSYTSATPTTYSATAAWTAGNNFTVQVNELPIDFASNPCCSTDNCLTLPDCP